jgi:hypothetical protein
MDGSAALARAKDMDQQGKESECMDALREAKRLSGARIAGDWRRLSKNISGGAMTVGGTTSNQGT